MDINLILSSITALAAIVSPSVTAHINNRAAYKQQSAQMFFNAKTEAYKKFLDVSSSISYPLTTAEFQKIREVYSHTLIFSSKEVQAALHTHLHTKRVTSKKFLSTALLNLPKFCRPPQHI